MHEDIIEHLPFLQRLCLEKEAQVILELGVCQGGSTKTFLKSAEVLGARVISIDLEDFSHISDSPRWEFHRMNDLDFEINEPIDILFIDTSHTYEQTLAELRKFAPKVQPNGVILLHDTVSCPEVKKAIEQYLKEVPGRYTFEERTNNNGLGILCSAPRS